MAGLRLMVPVQSRISLYGAAGGGVGTFDQAQATGGANPSVTSTNTGHGVFDFGGGIDIRFSQFFSIRVEMRDYVTGRGLDGMAGRNHPLVFGGVAWHF